MCFNYESRLNLEPVNMFRILSDPSNYAVHSLTPTSKQTGECAACVTNSTCLPDGLLIVDPLLSQDGGEAERF
jgi:hypothetical protein